MRSLCALLGAILELLLLTAPAARAAEMPPVDALQAQMGSAAATATVYEPHLSVGDAHTAVDYVGYPAVDVLAHLFGAPFNVNNLAQNESDVPLGPYYLVWDNIGNPALLAEGARNWPYQVAEVLLVTLSDAALLPLRLDERFHEGAALAKTHCLSCHMLNGYGGEKHEGNLAEITKGYEEDEFTSLVLAPLAVLDETTMPALDERLPAEERQRIAKALYDYLTALPVLDCC